MNQSAPELPIGTLDIGYRRGNYARVGDVSADGSSEKGSIPRLIVSLREWRNINRTRPEKWPQPTLSARSLNESAIRTGATFLALRVERPRRHSEVVIVVNGTIVTFPTSQVGVFEVDEFPVLPVPSTSNWLNRYAVLYPVIGAVNEVTIKMSLVSPVGTDGRWLPAMTRVVPANT